MTKSVQSLMIVCHPLASAITPKVVSMIRNSMPTYLVSVLVLVFQHARVFFVCKAGLFLVLFVNFFNYENNRFNFRKSESVNSNAEVCIAK